MEMLRKRSKGDAVEALQKKLLSQGINLGPVDGIFGPKTDDAIERFQQRQELQVDGIADPRTLGALGMLDEADDGSEAGDSSTGGHTGQMGV